MMTEELTVKRLFKHVVHRAAVKNENNNTIRNTIFSKESRRALRKLRSIAFSNKSRTETVRKEIVVLLFLIYASEWEDNIKITLNDWYTVMQNVLMWFEIRREIFFNISSFHKMRGIC